MTKPRAKLLAINPEPAGEDVLHKLMMAIEAADEMSAVAIVWIDRDACSHSIWSELHNSSTMIGAMERCKHQMMADD